MRTFWYYEAMAVALLDVRRFDILHLSLIKQLSDAGVIYIVELRDIFV
jgi:hypothetical protein